MFDTSVRDQAIRDQRERLEQERCQVLARVRSALEQMRAELGIREAFVIGSLVQPDRWDARSDVDVAVGAAAAVVLEIARRLEEITGRDVDVIDLDAHPRPGGVRSRGVRVYG